MKNAIWDYCSEREISIEELSDETNVSLPQLYLINKNPKYNVKIETINKIFLGTRNACGNGLVAGKYLDYECLKIN